MEVDGVGSQLYSASGMEVDGVGSQLYSASGMEVDGVRQGGIYLFLGGEVGY
jgi:hypothetical protein